MKSKIKKILSSYYTFAVVSAEISELISSPLRKENVVMFHCGRCGSSVVGALLNQHTKVRWAGEIFERMESKYGKSSWVWQRPLDMIYMRTSLNYKKVFGFEMKKRHLEDINVGLKKTIHYLLEVGYEKFVILKRKNYLDQDISKEVGKKIGKWNTSEDIKVPLVNVPVENLVESFKERDRFYEKLKRLIPEDKVLIISYEEDIKKSPKLAYRKLIEEVGLREEKVKTKIEKMNKKRTREKISNLQQVEKKLSKTKYEWMVK